MPPSQACQGRAHSEAGATWHDLHAFASVCRRDREERRRRAAPRLARSKFGVISMLRYCTFVDATLRNKSISFRNFNKRN